MVKVIRIFSVVFLVLWMALIFTLSAETAAESSKTSGSLIIKIVRFIDSDFEELSKEEQEQIISKYQFIARKGAHFALYGILGIFSFFTFITYKKLLFGFRFLISSFVCLLYSISDELHQKIIPGRSGELRDILIDFCGSLTAIIIFSLLTLWLKKEYIKNSKGVLNMRKKALIRLNEELFNRNEAYLLSLEKIKNENEELKKQIADLKETIENLNLQKEEKTEPMKVLEEKLFAQANLSSDTEFGAEIIGKIVVKATEHCNALSVQNDTAETKELINLILGRTEVAKAEILKIISSDISLDDKKSAICKEQNSAYDYFISVMAQKD